MFRSATRRERERYNSERQRLINDRNANWLVREGQDGPIVATHLTEDEAVNLQRLVGRTVFRRDGVPNVVTASMDRMDVADTPDSSVPKVIVLPAEASRGLFKSRWSRMSQYLARLEEENRRLRIENRQLKGQR